MATAESICIVGAKGMLGQELVKACSAEGNGSRLVHAIDIEDIDIADAVCTMGVLERLRPTLVINAAAYTDVDACETHRDLAMAVNGTGPGNLAEACRVLGGRLVHVSTDYVFDGRKGRPYLPNDPMNPQGVYGQSKAEGERRIRAVLSDHVIVRTSWLYASHSKNFVRTILKAARERDELKVVNDQVGCPTYAPDLAAVLLLLAHSGRSGTYHFCNAGSCSWYEFAKEIVRLAKLSTRVSPMSTAELNRPAPRPGYSVLNTDKTTQETGAPPRQWQESLATCMNELLRGTVE